MDHYGMFLCESASLATFNRINFYGCLTTPEILIQEPPYWLRVWLVCMGPCTEEMAGKLVRWGVFFEGTAPEHKSEGTFDSQPFAGDGIYKTFTLATPLNLELPSEGKLTTWFQIGGERYQREWSIKEGLAPKKGLKAPQESAGIFVPGSAPKVDISALLKAADRKLIIIDGYLGPNDLLQLVGTTNVPVQLLTYHGENSKNCSTYQAQLADLKNSIPKLEVRFHSKSFHDRFVIINDNEVYSFGHSLKNLGDKVSIFNKVYDFEIHNQVIQLFNTTWDQATPLK